MGRSKDFWTGYHLGRWGYTPIDPRAALVFVAGCFIFGHGVRLNNNALARKAEECRIAFEQTDIDPDQYRWVPDSTVLRVCGFVPQSKRKINYLWHKNLERPQNTYERVAQFFDCAREFEAQGKPEDYIYEASKDEIIMTCEVIPEYLD